MNSRDEACGQGGRGLAAKEHTRYAPLECHGRCGKRPYRALGGVVRSGQSRAGTRVYPGGSGRMVGKRTGFSHLETGFSRLFPDESMQVVDFPRIAYVRLFWEGKNSPQSRRDAEKKRSKPESAEIAEGAEGPAFASRQELFICTRLLRFLESHRRLREEWRIQHTPRGGSPPLSALCNLGALRF